MTEFLVRLLISVIQVRLGFVSIEIPQALPARGYMASFEGIIR